MKIDKDIPMPDPRGRPAKYDFAKMQIGDSFEVSDKDYVRIRGATQHYARRHPEFRFTIRKYNGAYRCWRIPTPENGSEL